MNLFKNIPGADNTEAIEKLIGTGDYGKAQGDVGVLIEQIRAQEALFEEAQEAFSIYTRNLQHVKNEGIISDDITPEILALLEEGDYAKAKESAENGILALAATTHDWYAARENGAIYLHTQDRLLTKGVVVPDERHTFAEKMELGDYKGGHTTAKKLKSGLFSIEAKYDAAQDALVSLQTEIIRTQQKGVVTDASMAEIEELFGKGEYAKAQKSAEKMATAVVARDQEFDAAQRALATLKNEIERLKRRDGGGS